MLKEKEKRTRINSEIISQIMMIIAILVILVNIVTEVLKSFLELKSAKVINITVTGISIILTVLVLMAYCEVKAILITWYMGIAFVVIGFMVAYAAMFGYDKLLSYFKDMRDK